MGPVISIDALLKSILSLFGCVNVGIEPTACAWPPHATSHSGIAASMDELHHPVEEDIAHTRSCVHLNILTLAKITVPGYPQSSENTQRVTIKVAMHTVLYNYLAEYCTRSCTEAKTSLLAIGITA